MRGPTDRRRGFRLKTSKSLQRKRKTTDTFLPRKKGRRKKKTSNGIQNARTNAGTAGNFTLLRKRAGPGIQITICLYREKNSRGWIRA